MVNEQRENFLLPRLDDQQLVHQCGDFILRHELLDDVLVVFACLCVGVCLYVKLLQMVVLRAPTIGAHGAQRQTFQTAHVALYLEQTQRTAAVKRNRHRRPNHGGDG